VACHSAEAWEGAQTMSKPFNNLAEALHRTRGWKWFATTDLTGAEGWTEPKESLSFSIVRCAPRKRRLTWVTRLTVFLLITASAGWLLNFIKHSL